MQDPGDLPARTSRPSLLSPGQQAEPDRQRILSALDGTARPAVPAGAARVPARRRASGLAWGGAVAAAAIVIGGVLFATSGEEAVAPAVHVAAASVPAPAAAPVAATPAPAAAPAAAAAAAAPVDTAAVLHEMPQPQAAVPNPLSELAPTHASRTGHGDTLTRALETPSKKDAHAHKEIAQRKAEPAKAAAGKPAKDKPVKEKPAKRKPEQDSDVVLLAALMSHMQMPNRKATVAERLQVCKGYNAAGEAQCRARVCAGVAASEPTCKGVTGAVAASPDN